MQEKLYVDGLSHYFDVTLIEEDCNFQAVCDRTNPDLAIFESGKALLHRRIKIEGAKNENSSHNENCWGLLGGLALF